MNFHRLPAILSLLAVSLAHSAYSAPAPAAVAKPTPRQPHIIFIEVDDLPASYSKVWGSRTSPTPTLDKLAREGYVFENAMAQGMMCGPSRNSLMVGRYPHQLGFYQNGDMRKLPKDSWTLPHALKRAGYTTAWVGKSHLRVYFEGKRSGAAANFNSFFGFDHSVHTVGRVVLGDEDGGKVDADDPYLAHLRETGMLERFQEEAKSGRNSTLPEDIYLDGWFAKNAEETIAKHDVAKPLFLWVNFSVPHGPYDVADPYHEPFASAKMPGVTRTKNYQHPESLIRRTKSYANERKAIADQRGLHANIAFMDHSVDRVLDALRRRGMFEDAWIVFFSDQGAMVGSQGLIHKSTLFRQITNPALIIRPPGGAAKPSRISAPAELLDLLPTTLALARADSEKAPAGVSLLPLLRGEPNGRAHAFAEIEPWIAASDGRFRLIRSVGAEGAFLFDDIADPENLEDIAASRPEKVKELGAAIDGWLKRTGPRLPAKSF